MKEINFEIRVPNFQMFQEWQKKLKIVLSVLVAIGSFLAWQSFDFTVIGTLILVYFGISLIWNLSSRIAASLALFFLICTPVLLAMKNDDLAETMAIYAYYLLVITVVSEIWALRKP